MDSLEARTFPERTEDDVIHAVVKGGLSLASGGTLGDLFAFLIKAPYERRLEAWLATMEMRVRHLAERDKELFARLPDDATFATILLSATQAALRTHRDEKISLLAAAVENCAIGINIAEDLQVLFVSFVDELMPSHIALLAFLAANEALVVDVKTYDQLHEASMRALNVECTKEEFKLLCNDLGSRVLVRFSDAIDDFAGVAREELLATDSSGVGPKVVVTHLGYSLLAFVTPPSSPTAL